MKVLKILCITFFIAVLYSTCLYAGIEDRIIAVVNDEVITFSEFEEIFESFMKRIEKSSPGETEKEKIIEQVRPVVLNRLIESILLEQESKKQGIEVTEHDINSTIQQMVDERKITIEEFKKVLSTDGETIENYKREIRDQLIKLKLLQKEIKPKTAVSDQEIGDYYTQHRNDYEGKEAVRIQQILIIIPKNSNSDTKEKLWIDVTALLERLKNGESFEFLARKYSQGPAAKSGGDLGFVEKGMMFPEVDQVAFTLTQNSVSDVIESPIGFHIIKVIDKKGAGIKSFELVREEIRQKIGNQKMEKNFKEWLEELKNKSHIDVRL